MHDRPQPGERHARADVDQQLLADADVDDAVRVPRGSPGRSTRAEISAKTSMVEGPRRAGRSTVRPNWARGSRTRVVHAATSSSTTVATTAFGAPTARSESAFSSASWSRPSTVATSQPSVAKRSRDAAGHGVARAAVVDDDHRERVEPESGRELERLVVGALVELGVTDEHDHARSRCPGPAGPSAVPTPSGRPCPSEPLEISTPGTRFRSGWWPRGESKDPHDGQPRLGEEATVAEHGVVRRRAVTLRQQEPVAARDRRRCRARRRAPARRAPGSRPGSSTTRGRASRRRSSGPGVVGCCPPDQ